VAGLTSTGLSVKRLQDIRDEITARLTAFFGEDINTTEDSVFGQLRDSVAPGESSLWEQLQIVYDSQYPSRAEGQQLDDSAALVGVFRKGNITSKINASVTGDNNVLLPTGFTVAVNTTQDEFEIVEPKAITSSSTTKTIISVDVVSNSTAYTVTIDAIDAVYTSDGSATEAEIVAGLIAAIPIAIPTVTAVSTSNSNEVLITSVDETDAKDITLDTNISFVKVTTLIPLQSKDYGPIVAPIDQLIDIKTFISGVDSATNKTTPVLGFIEESDADFRERREVELAKTGSSSVLAIRDRINLVEDVRSTVILENYTGSVDGNGLVAHSIQAIVDGGVSADVAQAIFDTKPVGTDMNGAVTETITDSMGIDYDIKFDRPTEVPIYIEITLTTFSDYPSDGDDAIKAALVEYATNNLFAGDDVITSRLYSPINATIGHQVDSLFISTSASPTLDTPITIALTELATFSLANISIV